MHAVVFLARGRQALKGVKEVQLAVAFHVGDELGRHALEHADFGKLARQAGHRPRQAHHQEALERAIEAFAFTAHAVDQLGVGGIFSRPQRGHLQLGPDVQGELLPKAASPSLHELVT